MPKKNSDIRYDNNKIKAVPKPKPEVGMDIDNDFYSILLEAGESSHLDISEISKFSTLSNNRETLYQLLDTMGQDPTIAASLEIYAEDATESNDSGSIVWCQSPDEYVGKYVTFLLKSLQIDKHIYEWIYSLCKYGDVYVKLFRHSDFEDKLFDGAKEDEDETEVLNEFLDSKEPDKETLNEDVILKVYDKHDKFVDYVEMVPNPAEMFELVKHGKTYAYIKTNTLPQAVSSNMYDSMRTDYWTYKFKRRDIEVSNAVSYVHASLQDNTPRVLEQVDITMDDDTNSVYTVRRGQSILYNSFKIWRQTMLLENSMLLNRLTKSSIVRVIEVEVGDMPKENVGPQLQRVKQLIEQKTSVNAGNDIQEYTNPGPMDNCIYVPTHGGIGNISLQQVGGDVNVKDIADIDYFKNKLYSSLKIPKQFLGDTDDAAGFNGGTSLSIISSRYAKTVKRIQETVIQMVTDLINILLIDKGLNSYVNKFELFMEKPTTQEDLDRRESISSRIGITDDIMRLLEGIEDPVTRLKILKSLIANVITDPEIMSLIQEQIDILEEQKEESPEGNPDEFGDYGAMDGEDFDFGSLGGSGGGTDIGGPDLGGAEASGPEPEFNDNDLPSPNDLGVDMTEM